MGNKSSGSDSTTLTNEIEDLLIANTKYSRDEIREWHMGFIKDCPKGTLDKRKFRDVYRCLKGSNVNVDKFCELTFKAFDTDDSGTIDFYEFMLALAATQNGNPEDRLSAAFDIYDIDRNGVIDLKEMNRIFTAVYDLNGIQDRKGDKSPKKKAESIMNRMDKSGRKKISKEDFISSCLRDEDLKAIFAPYA